MGFFDFLGGAGVGGAIGGPIGEGIGGFLGATNSGPFANNPRPGETPQPLAPTYTPGWLTQNAVSPGLQNQLNGINVNTQGLDQYRKEATRQGPSSWANQANAQQKGNAQYAQQKASNDAASSAATARSALAMRGGLSGGARERIARQQGRDVVNAGQQINQNAGNNMASISMQDETNRMNQLGALPGMENQALQPAFQKAQMGLGANEFDVGQQANEAGNRNAFNANQYQNQMSAWAAANLGNQEQYNAQHTGGLFNSGGFLGLGL